ncbi:MAG: hypothetical protein HeimC2_32970 [Candidatus Heimdallarchaeota archaeon LC_2]|nr:MAG: hypothetical protein HeimC2_32970 [Candidatus Heimdallarchaeota archaeon LC_2]
MLRNKIFVGIILFHFLLIFLFIPGLLFNIDSSKDCENGSGYTLFDFEHRTLPITYSFNSSVPQMIKDQTVIALEIWDNLISINLFERNNTDFTLFFEHRKISPEDRLFYDLDNPIGYADIYRNRSNNGDFDYFYNATIVFNLDYQFEDLEFSCNIWDSILSNKTVDILSIALHEIGHVLGLDHTLMYSLTMSPSYQGTFQKTLAQGDINGFNELFGGYEI